MGQTWIRCTACWSCCCWCRGGLSNLGLVFFGFSSFLRPTKCHLDLLCSVQFQIFTLPHTLASCLHHIQTLRGAVSSMLSPSKGQSPLTTSQHPFGRLATLRRQASTKVTALGYKPTAPSSKKSPAAPPTGFAAIGSYNTIARR